MKRAAHFLALAGLLSLFAVAGCKKQVSDADAIRDGINQHLAGLKTINLARWTWTSPTIPSREIRHRRRWNSGRKAGVLRACKFPIRSKSRMELGLYKT